MASFDPLIQLKTLLGDKPNHPWGALIPQVLLWCFRRFCIQKLTETSEALLSDQLWDDHLDLIRQHAPKGLESVSASWFTPENIDHVHSSLEEYNRFFMEILVYIDESVRESDSDKEDHIAEFMDVKIKEVICDWLSTEYAPFLIFPMTDKDDDEFTDAQFEILLDALMTFMKDTIPVPEPFVVPLIARPSLPPPSEVQQSVISFTPPTGFEPPDPMSYLSSPLPLAEEDSIYIPPQTLFVQYPTSIKDSVLLRKTRRKPKLTCVKTRRIH